MRQDPNYRLAACHQANAELLADVHVLRMSDIPKCYGFILWDAEADCLITVDDFHQRRPEVMGQPQAA